MDLIVAILIYLGILISPGQYGQSEIDRLSEENKDRIYEIRENESVMDQIIQDLKNNVEGVIVIDADES